MGIEQAKSNHRFFSKRNSIRITTSKPNALIRTFWNSFWEKFWFRFCKLTQEQNLKHMDFRNRQKHSKRLLICQNHQNEILKVKKMALQFSKEFNRGQRRIIDTFWTKCCRVWQKKIYLLPFVDRSNMHVQDFVYNSLTLPEGLERLSPLLLSYPQCSSEVKE